MGRAKSLHVFAVIIIFSAVVFPAAAETIRKYMNKECGYALSCPESWYIGGGGNRVDIQPVKDCTAASKCAGLTIRIDPVIAEEGRIVEKIAERITRDIAVDARLDERSANNSARRIGSREWQAFSYTASGGSIEGEIFILVREASVMSINTFYQGKGAWEAYVMPITDALQSFSFAATGYLMYRNDRRGVSFSYPDNLAVDEAGDLIALVLVDRSYGSYPYSAIQMGAMEMGAEELKETDGLDDASFIGFLNSHAPQDASLSPPEPITLSQTTWMRSEAVSKDVRSTVLLKRVRSYLFMVSLVIPPKRDEKADRAVWETFLKSLTFDTEAWIASVGKK